VPTSATSSGSFPATVHYELAHRALKGVSDAATLIDKAEACGVDVSQYREGCQYIDGIARSFIREFFPNQVLPPHPPGVPQAHE
jgi:hypothetical protein